MTEWYKVMFPTAKSEDELVLLYSHKALLGIWEVHTHVTTFKYQPFKQPNSFYLFWNDADQSVACMESVYDAIKAVSQHRTGVSEWDEASCEASDSLLDWKREVSSRVIFNFIDHWMEHNPNGNLREMVDYFEHEDTHLINRMNIIEFLKEMIVSGQMTRFPRVWMPPAEMRPVIRLAKEYGVPMRDEQEHGGT